MIVETNPWRDLTDQANQGELVIQDGRAARAAAEFTADVLATIGVVEARIVDIDAHKGFSDNGHLASALALAGKFNGTAGALRKILTGHRELLSDMGETFVAAGNLYANTEHDSKDMFDQIKTDMTAKIVVPPPPKPGATPPPAWSGRPMVTGPRKTIQYDTTRIDPGNPYGHHADWFVLVGAGITAQTVMDTAGVWGWMADRLDTAFATLTERLVDMERDKVWTGKGMNGAIVAANAYHDNVALLAESMRLVDQNLRYTSSWLAATKAQMPTSFDPERDAERESAMIEQATRAYVSTYIPGHESSSAMVPILPDASSVPPPPEPKAETQNPDTDPARSGGTPHVMAAPTSGPGVPPPSPVLPPVVPSPPVPVAPPGAPAVPAPAPGVPSDSRPGTTPGNPPGSPSKPPTGTAPRPPADTPSSASPSAGSPSSALAQARSLFAAGANGLPQPPKDGARPPGSAPNPRKMSGAGVPGGAGSGGGAPASPPPVRSLASAKLFPRATPIEPITNGGTGIPGSSGAGQPGMVPPGTPGNGNNGRREHQRAEYLTSDEHLDEAIGGDHATVRAVVRS
ncbi:hypothetical protein [Nocardia sp. NPDC052566]|uniref:hypothetical protein n=1 Tax=Nocardia sp. NPDC052566 TaxID=3364330 RepID=UPI0037C5EB39